MLGNDRLPLRYSLRTRNKTCPVRTQHAALRCCWIFFVIAIMIYHTSDQSTDASISAIFSLTHSCSSHSQPLYFIRREDILSKIYISICWKDTLLKIFFICWEDILSTIHFYLLKRYFVEDILYSLRRYFIEDIFLFVEKILYCEDILY